HAQKQPRLIGDGALVVGQARTVGGAALTQHGAPLGPPFSDAEKAADFHQFAAGDNDLSAFGQRIQRQHHSSGTVVDHYGANAADGLLVEQAGEEALNVDVALAAFAGDNVELQVGVAACDFSDALDRRFR